MNRSPYSPDMRLSENQLYSGRTVWQSNQYPSFLPSHCATVHNTPSEFR